MAVEYPNAQYYGADMTGNPLVVNRYQSHDYH